MQQVTRETPRKKRKNPAAVALGRLGGRKGGKARAAKLSPRRRREIAIKARHAQLKRSTPEERSKIARNAVLARWKNHPTSKI